jgi:hypothetical protein
MSEVYSASNAAKIRLGRRFHEFSKRVAAVSIWNTQFRLYREQTHASAIDAVSEVNRLLSVKIELFEIVFCQKYPFAIANQLVVGSDDIHGHTTIVIRKPVNLTPYIEPHRLGDGGAGFLRTETPHDVF